MMDRKWILAAAVWAASCMWWARPAAAQTPVPLVGAPAAGVPVSPTVAVTATQPVSTSWLTLTDRGGGFAVQFPGDWTASQTEAGEISLENPLAEVVSVMVFSSTVTDTAETSVGLWVKALQPAWLQLGEKVVADQRGRWDRGVTGAFARVATVSVEGQNEHLLVVAPAPDGRIIAVSDAQSGMMLTEENLGRLELILRSLRLPDRAGQALPPPVPAATQQQSGRGPQTNAPIKLTAGQATFRITHDGAGLFTLFLLNAQGQRVAYLGQALGALDRIYSLAVPLSADYALAVTADGAWTVTVEQ
jgi:hypothetical protein